MPGGLTDGGKTWPSITISGTAGGGGDIALDAVSVFSSLD